MNGPPVAWLPIQIHQFLNPSQEVLTLVGVIAVLGLLGLSAFFASAEIAIFSLADHRIGTLVDERTPGAATLSKLKSDPRRLLVTILVGNNIANIGMSSIVTGLLGFYVDPGQSVLIATFGVTSLVLLFGESAPKSYAVEHSESWALRIARPLRGAQLLMIPLVAVFDRLTRAVNRLMGSSGEFEKAYVTRAEVGEVITAGQRAGALTDDEHRMLQRLLRFRNRIVKEAMVPRLDVVAIDVESDLDAAVETCLESEYDQLPVYEGVLDDVVGVVHLRDVIEARNRQDPPSLREIAMDPVIVPETKEVDDLLRELRAEREQMAIVVDEFGTTSGIVTIEDIVEEIIGEVLAEHESPPIRWLDDESALLRGELNVHAANEFLGIELPESPEFETVAGLLIHQTGRLVEEGDAIVVDGVRLVVETTENTRVLEVRIELDQLESAPTEPENES